MGPNTGLKYTVATIQFLYNNVSFKGTMAAFYNGVRIPYRVFQEGDPKEEWSTSAYKIYINADWKSGERMDIPSEYVSLDNYCATLGHKINHSFRPNCEEWFFDHPRFGLVPCERAKKDIKVVVGRVPEIRVLEQFH